MRLNNWSIAASHDTARVFAGLGFGSSTARRSIMLGGFQETAFDFVADNPERTLFHYHQQLHMDFGFMALFDYL